MPNETAKGFLDDRPLIEVIILGVIAFVVLWVYMDILYTLGRAATFFGGVMLGAAAVWFWRNSRRQQVYEAALSALHPLGDAVRGLISKKPGPPSN